MSWRKYFKPVNDVNPGTRSPVGSTRAGHPGASRLNYSSFLPDVYSGSPNRIDRMNQYETMDWDSEVNAALDILAEFTTQRNKENGTPFTLHFNNRATNTEVTVLKEYLQQWNKLQDFNTRVFRIARNTFKYGDTFFIRDPETLKWSYVDPTKVVKIIVNESEGKRPEQYVIRDLNINFAELITTQINPSIQQPNAVSNNVQGGNAGRGMNGFSPQNTGNRFTLNQGEFAVNADHVVHLSLSEGLDNNYPFGNSLLESVFKVYKQKELLEDAVIIYRVQRAPERRVFYIDVGSMPSHLAMSFVERVKNEIHQRRIPSATGGSTSVIDSSYNPLSIGEDYYFPQTAEGRGSKVETLPGGCFTMDTKVPLLDGRTLSIREVAYEMSSGKELWTYSINPATGKVVPGLISWAGVTDKAASIVKITLSNGKVIKCTPDHKFPVFGGRTKCAEELKVDDALIPFGRKHVFANGTVQEEAFNSQSMSWVKTSELVTVSEADYKLRYIDGDTTNNHPNNVVVDCGNGTSKISAFKRIVNFVKNYTKLAISSANCLPDSCFIDPVYVEKVEVLDGEFEVGTLTIDKYEKHHGHHTFALNAGVFTYNSSLGEIDDLRYFTNKLMRALRIPSSYLPTGADDSQGQFNDGRVGTAYIQELRFNKYCERLQQLMVQQFDKEFKLFLHKRGVNIDYSLFELKFQSPQNFASYRQAELDNQRIGTFTQIVTMPFMSKRFALKRFLGMTEEDIAENEQLWKEENGEFAATTTPDASGELRGAGITPSGMEADLAAATPPDEGMGDEMPPPMDTESPPPQIPKV